MSAVAASSIVRLPVWRARLVMAALLAAFAVLAARSVYLQALDTDFLQGKGEARYSRVLEIPGTRGRILDRNGEALAISTPVQSVWAIPGDVEATPAQLRSLARLLGVEPRELKKKLGDASRDFVLTGMTNYRTEGGAAAAQERRIQDELLHFSGGSAGYDLGERLVAPAGAVLFQRGDAVRPAVLE